MHIHTKPDQRNERIPGGKRRGIKKVAGDLRAAIIIEGAIDNLGGQCLNDYIIQCPLGDRPLPMSATK